MVPWALLSLLTSIFVWRFIPNKRAQAEKRVERLARALADIGEPARRTCYPSVLAGISVGLCSLCSRYLVVPLPFEDICGLCPEAYHAAGSLEVGASLLATVNAL